MGYTFIEKEGLYYGDEYISEFSPEVVSVKYYYYLDTGIRKRIFSIKAKNCDGTETECMEVENLNSISYFNLWNIPDCDLTGNQKKRLTHKLQTDVAGIKAERIIIGKQGLYFYEDYFIYIWGNKILSTRCQDQNWKIQISTKMSLQNSKFNTKNIDLISKYLNFFPGVSEIVFYGALFAVVKPILCRCGLKPDFILALVGPSGHLKTTLVRKYALWFENREMQESSFRDYKRINQIINMLDDIPGHNFLVDDFHEAISGNVAIKQSERLDSLVRHVGLHANCANVFITGESSKKMGIFSSMDRLLQIKIHKKTSEELKDLKIKMNELHEGEMVHLAGEFLAQLMQNFDEATKIIKEYWLQDCSGEDINFDTRTFQHGKFIKLTEILFRKYMCLGCSETSGREKLYDALSVNYAIQQRELQRKWQDERDYVVDVYTMLKDEDKYIKVESSRALYQASDERCLYCDDKIYITRNALARGMSEYYQKIVPLKKIIDALHEADILDEDNDSRTKKFLNKRHYVLSVKMMERYVKWNLNEN